MSRSQKKTLLILVIILLLLVIVLVAIQAGKRSSAQQAEEEAAAEEADSVITEADAAYTALSYNNGSATLSFQLDEAGNWVWADDPEFPLNDTTVQNILQLLTNLAPQQTITEGDTLEAYGLDQPFATLTATGGDGTTLTIALGNTTTDGDSYYMLMNGQESPVYIIADTLYNYMSTTIYDMCALPELPELTEDRIQSVTVEGSVTTVLRAENKETQTDPDTGEETVTVTWTSGGEDVTEHDDVVSLLSDLESMAMDKCVDYKPSDEAVTLCGFDAPRAVLTIVYETETGTEETLTLTFGGDALEDADCYVRMEEDTTIYQMSESDVETILAIAETGLTTDTEAAE